MSEQRGIPLPPDKEHEDPEKDLDFKQTADGVELVTTCQNLNVILGIYLPVPVKLQYLRTEPYVIRLVFLDEEGNELGRDWEIGRDESVRGMNGVVGYMDVRIYPCSESEPKKPEICVDLSAPDKSDGDRIKTAHLKFTRLAWSGFVRRTTQSAGISRESDIQVIPDDISGISGTGDDN